MGNHLRELLDCKELAVQDFADAEYEARLAAKLLREVAAQAVCFDLGSMEDLARLDSDAMQQMQVDLPYETTWFEFTFTLPDGKQELCGALFGAHKKGEAALCAFARRGTVWGHLFNSTTRDNMRVISIGDSHLPDGTHTGVLGSVRTALCAMRCVNIDKIEHKPSEKLQKARAKKGKQPLFSYWTLEINLPNSRKAGQEHGGSHASPRLHLRRGHAREYRPGLFCWVQPHAVGSKKLGMVHKDYAAKCSTAQTPNVKSAA